jgi:hypothetical protein
MNHRRQRQAYETLLAEGDVAAVASQVSIPEVVALVERRGSETDRLRTLDRVMRTANGRRAFELLQAATFAVKPPISVERRYAIPLALAALLVIGAAAGGLMMMRTDRVSEAMLSTRQDVVVLQGPANDVEVTDEVTFSWRSVSGARSYDLEIMDDGNLVVFSRSLGTNTIALSLRELLRPGASYQWRVSAIREQDSLVSRPRTLRLTAR